MSTCFSRWVLYRKCHLRSPLRYCPFPISQTGILTEARQVAMGRIKPTASNKDTCTLQTSLLHLQMTVREVHFSWPLISGDFQVVECVC